MHDNSERSIDEEGTDIQYVGSRNSDMRGGLEVGKDQEDQQEVQGKCTQVWAYQSGFQFSEQRLRGLNLWEGGV